MCENYKSKRRAPAAPGNSRCGRQPLAEAFIKEGMAVIQPLDDRVRQALTRSQLIDMTTTGRTSGEPRRIEIVLHNIDGRLYISGRPSPHKRKWIANLEADPRLTVHLKRSVRADLPARARIISDETERRSVLGHVARAWNVRDVEPMVRHSPLIEVTPDPN